MVEFGVSRTGCCLDWRLVNEGNGSRLCQLPDNNPQEYVAPKI